MLGDRETRGERLVRELEQLRHEIADEVRREVDVMNQYFGQCALGDLSLSEMFTALGFAW